MKSTVSRSRKNRLRLALLSLAMTLVGIAEGIVAVWMTDGVLRGSALCLALLWVGLFGMITVIAVIESLGPGVALSFDTQGVTYTSTIVGVVALQWLELESIRIVPLFGNRFLSFEPSNPDLVLSQQSWGRRLLSRMSVRLGQPLLSLPEKEIDASLEEVLSSLEKCRKTSLR